MLSQQGRRCPDARRRDGPKGRSRLTRLSPHGVLNLDDVVVEDGLLIPQDLSQPLCGQDGYIGRPQRLEPGAARTRLERRLHHRIVSPQAGSVSAAGARLGDLLLGQFLDHLLHQRHLIGRGHHVNPNPVATLEKTGDHALRQPELERGTRLLGACPVHGERHQGTLEQAGVNGSDATLTLAHEQTRENPGGRQVHGAPARQRKAQEDGTVTMALLLIHQTHTCLDEDVVARTFGVRVIDGVAQNRAGDERGKALAQRGVIEALPSSVAGPQTV